MKMSMLTRSQISRAVLMLATLGSLATVANSINSTPVGALTPQRLRCEYRIDPLGVDRSRPELSWIVTSDLRDQVQSAYRILVSSSLQKLNGDMGDLWDSGKVAGNSTYGVVYSGVALKSHQECVWKVKAWDGADRAGPWSEPARWSVGILNPNEWQGEWIGYDSRRKINDSPPAAPLHGARWICHAADKVYDAPSGNRVYFGIWDLPEKLQLARATLTVTADDTSKVLLNRTDVAHTQHHQQPVTEEVTAFVRPGRNEIRVICRNNTRGPTGLCLKLVATPAHGEDYVLTSDDRWYSVVNTGEPWRTGAIKGAAPVRVLGPFGCKPWGLPAVHRDVSAPPSYMRGTFQIDRPVRRAVVYLAALGWADLTLNGELVNTDYFSSGWTDYRKRVYYRAYDVTDKLLDGANVWGAVLADGWYSGHVGWDTQRDLYGVKPRFRAMLRVNYEDGTDGVFSTDRTWIVVRGPETLADILVGEEYDATAENQDWDRPGSLPEKLGDVDHGAEVAPKIQWHPGPPVIEVAEFPAQSITEPRPGVYVFDIGQNIAGVARIKVRGRRGQRVQLRYAERLNRDGTLYTENLRLARAIDRYICRGGGEEVWQPRQTYHGFQYVEVTGVEGRPPLDAVIGIALSSATNLASEFECSDKNLNRLYQNVLWTQRSNFIDIPTDCPQRDERLGWTGDAQVYVHTASLVADIQAFFRKWLVDLTDAQRDDGQFPRVAPLVLGQTDGGPAWADAGVICPWEIYQAYGDRALLKRQYPSMVRFVEFCRARSVDGVLPPSDFHCFGDWLSVNADTPREVIYMAYYARSVDLLRQSAEVLGIDDDVRKYAALFRRIKEAFQGEFVRDDGRIRGDTQCAYVLAIGYGLVDGELRDRAAQRLVQDIESRGWRLSTGFVGTKDLMLVLSEIGRTDVALRLLHQPEYPGWMFSISQGATSIWERWDGWTPNRGFQDPGMNSFAHYAFGAVYGWMAEHLGGIQRDLAGFGRVVIKPTFDPKLSHCRVKYDSIRGPIETEWRMVADQTELRVSIPANVNAVLKLTGQRVEDILLDGVKVAATSLTATDSITQNGAPTVKIDLPSGDFDFSMPTPR